MSAAAIKTLEELKIAATKDGKIKWPLDCGCVSEHYHGLCDSHKAERIEDHRRLMGIADLRFTHRDFLDLPALVNVLQAIKLQLISNPTKSCVIKIIPETQDEANARRRD